MDILKKLEDAGSRPVVDLAELSAMAEHMLEVQADVDRIETELKRRKKDLADIQERKLPEALEAAGVKSFALTNGQTVLLHEDMKISVPKSRKAEIVRWLKKHGFEAFITSQLSVNLGKGSQDEAAKLADFVEKLGLKAIQAEDINSGTLKKILKDRQKAGQETDLAFFGAFDFKTVKVK